MMMTKKRWNRWGWGDESDLGGLKVVKEDWIFEFLFGYMKAEGYFVFLFQRSYKKGKEQFCKWTMFLQAESLPRFKLAVTVYDNLTNNNECS